MLFARGMPVIQPPRRRFGRHTARKEGGRRTTKAHALGYVEETAKKRMHIDIRVAGEAPWEPTEREQRIREKVAELVAAGATTVREEYYGRQFGHVVMLRSRGQRALRRMTRRTRCVERRAGRARRPRPVRTPRRPGGPSAGPAPGPRCGYWPRAGHTRHRAIGTSRALRSPCWGTGPPRCPRQPDAAASRAPQVTALASFALPTLERSPCGDGRQRRQAGQPWRERRRLTARRRRGRPAAGRSARSSGRRRPAVR